MIQDEIEEALKARFEAGYAGQEFGWDSVAKYAIDDAVRTRSKAAVGMVDQGQKFMPKTSISQQRWRIAIEFFVRCNSDEDIKNKVNTARRIIFKTMMDDMQLGGLILDTNAVADEVYVDRMDQFGEGVMLFDIDYRTLPTDIGVAI